MKLSHLLAALPDFTLCHDPEATSRLIERPVDLSNLPPIDISGITADSRQVTAGALFVAYPGVSLDGHQFIAEALQKGAAAIICEDVKRTPARFDSCPLIKVPDGRQALAYLAAAWHNFPARRLRMVGITGTDGKTTTTNFLYHILRAAGQKVGMINTVNAVIGDDILETGLHTTTPDAPDIQRYLAQMVAAGIDTCLLEVTSHGLAHQRVAACEFDAAIVTNIAHEHLDLHGSIEAYRTAKARLFESLARTVEKGFPKAAILNCDDWSFAYLKEKLTPARTTWLGYSLTEQPQASFTAHHIACRPDKTSFTVRGGGHEFGLETTLVGDYNVSNCLAATAAAVGLLGAGPRAVRQGVAALAGIPGRMERIAAGQPFLAIVDFAHTPNAMRRSLAAARRLNSGRVIAVFGCAGLRDVGKRTIMGHIAAELADLTIITAEDPRTETLEAIIDETARAMIDEGAIEGKTFWRVPDRGQAIYRAVELARPDDVVIVLGKGHEQSMCFGQVEYPWDDRQAMRSALRGAPLLTLPTA
jgi:UDP-N-acetylmuramoyl-L-alanyl-D-glutamate--2,6-diaminopimelate ligase